ncbi:telomere recombination domain protein [Leptospira interrogans serovar Bataviae str. HAI135]|nr:telomere recombination domain protein [Leptospira interrogans serovar Bataviae str. HAI135]
MILSLHPINPEKRKLQQISDQLSQGKVYIFPTDTVYALVADSQSKPGVEKLYELKNISKNQPLSLICSSISVASNYIEHLSNDAFRLMKKLRRVLLRLLRTLTNIFQEFLFLIRKKNKLEFEFRMQFIYKS